MSNVRKEKEADKELLLEQLKKTPIVQIACEKTGVGRTTFYRWKKDDAEFAEKVQAAVREGNDLVNDVAESQLMAAIRTGNLTAVVFWLRNHHPAYAAKLQLSGEVRMPKELSPEQRAIIREALRLAALPAPRSEPHDGEPAS